MFMLKCPVCQERGISPWDKVFVSVWRKIICKYCGTRVKWGLKTTIVWHLLSYPLGLILFVAGFLALHYIGILGALLVFAVFLATALLFPLRKVDP